MNIHIDIGGEGSHPGAINVNPSRVTTTVGVPGSPIPNLIQATGEQLPFRTGSVDKVTMENAPIRPRIAREIARVLGVEGVVLLRHPTDYALQQGTHDAVHAALGPGFVRLQAEIVPDLEYQSLFRRIATTLLR